LTFRTFAFLLNNLGNCRIKEIIAPIRTEKIIEYPTDMPSIFTKNKSKEIMSGLMFENIKRNVMSKIKRMK
tara:strand:+ start:137 stop:349 length:213 start_codon:yes stop_codon:yes gene_type:complete